MDEEAEEFCLDFIAIREGFSGILEGKLYKTIRI